MVISISLRVVGAKGFDERYLSATDTTCFPFSRYTIFQCAKIAKNEETAYRIG